MLNVTGRFISGEKNEAYVAAVIRAPNRGSRTQNFSTEMLHWDDYRGSRNLNDGTPTMASLFRGAPVKVGWEETVFRVKDRAYSTEKIIVASPAFAGLPCQSLCAEMVHWDDLRAARGLMAPGEQPLATQFSPPIVSRTFHTYDKARGTVSTYVSKNVSVLRDGEGRGTYCAEMDHLDEFCKARGIAQQTTMATLFAN